MIEGLMKRLVKRSAQNVKARLFSLTGIASRVRYFIMVDAPLLSFLLVESMLLSSNLPSKSAESSS
jgi:hypothetical protein